MTELFIENNRVDLTADASMPLTFSIDDIRDFASRNCTFSKTIILPGTANNNRLFGNIFDVSVSSLYTSGSNVSTNFNAAVSASILLFQNRIQTMKGTLRLMEIVIDGGNVEYEVALFGELGGLVSALGNKKIEELDFSAYDVIWNATNIISSWNNLGSDVVFPLIDYGGVSVAKVNYDIQAFRPALFVKEYIDKIMTGAGYRYSFPLADTDRFKGLVVPNNQKTLQTKETTSLFVEGTQASTKLQFNVHTQLGSFTPDFDSEVFTYTGDTFIALININSDFQIDGYGGYANVIFQLYKNGSLAVSSDPYQISDGIEPVIKDYKLSIANGDTIEVRYTIQNYGDPYTLVFNYHTLSAVSTSYVWTNANDGDTLKINDTIPRNVYQRDFLSSIIKLFNLYLYESVLDSKKIYITPYVDFYDVSGFTDWTYKVDRSRPTRYKPMSELTSRYYNFKFKSDSDYYNDSYQKKYDEVFGSYLFDSAFEFSNDKTDIELIFSPSVLVGYAGKDKIVSSLFKMNNGIEEKMSTNIRLMQFKKVTGVSSWDITGSAGGTGLTNYGYAGNYDDPDAPANDIHFGTPNELYFTLVSGSPNVHQFNVYWSPYMSEITDKDSKLMTAFVKLDEADIFNLDFSKYVFIDGSLWRLNKIEDYDAMEPGVCRCEFLKVIIQKY